MVIKSNRRLFTTLIIVVTLTIAFFANLNSAQAADKIKIRLSATCAENAIEALGINHFGELLGEDFEFKAYYRNTLFKQGTAAAAMQRGNLEMGLIAAQDISKQLPVWSIFTAGYVIRDGDHLHKVFYGEIGAEMLKLVADKMNIKIIGVMNLGTRHLNLRGDKKIMKPEDLRGVKLRMPGTETYQFLGKALGADVTPMAFSEVYTGLQLGTIDAQDNPLPNDKVMKFYEVTNQIVLTGHLVDPQLLSIAKPIWDKLTPDQKAKMQAAADEAVALNNKERAKQEAELVDFFKKEGLKVYTPDREAFRKHVQKMYLESKYSKSWPEGLLERINAVQ